MKAIRFEFNTDSNGSTPLPYINKSSNLLLLKDSIAWRMRCLSEKELSLLKTITIQTID
jgi:hypothetical protein